MKDSLAIVRDGLVVTFVRPDVPDGWAPPAGCVAIDASALPDGWRYAERTAEEVPSSVTARQIRLWLVRSGISLSAVESAIDSIHDASVRDAVRVEWEYAPYVERSHPWLSKIAEALGLEDSAIDAAFREASLI